MYRGPEERRDVAPKRRRPTPEAARSGLEGEEPETVNAIVPSLELS